MAYTIEMYVRYNTGNIYTYTIYDGAENQAWGISLRTGGNDIGTLEFTVEKGHTYATSLRNALMRIDYQVSLLHGYGNQTGTRLFTGYVTNIEHEMDGTVRVTCKDEFFVLENVHLRLVSGLVDEAMTLKEIALSAKDQYNASCDPAFTITAIREVYGYSNGSESYRTITSSSSSSEQLGSKSHTIGGRSVMTFLDAFKIVAEDVGGVLRMEYVSFGERRIVVSYATENTRAHVYSYGESLLKCTVREDGEDYRNAVFPSGGTGIGTDGGGAWFTVKTSMPVLEGDEVITITKNGSGSFTTGAGDLLTLSSGGETTNYNVRSPKSVGVSSGEITRLTIDPPAQDGIASGTTGHSIKTDPITTDAVVELAAGSNTTTDAGNAVAATEDKSAYLRSLTHLSMLRMEGTYSDTSIISGTKLRRVSYDILDEYVQTATVTRSVDVAFVEKGLSGEGYYANSERSHTYVGEVVHVNDSVIDVNDDLRVNAMSLTVGEPQSYNYTVGKPRKTVTGNIKKLDKRTSGLR